MYGGIAIAGNLLCVSYTDARGNLFLVDVEEKRLASHWSYAGDDPRGYADAGGVSMDEDYNIFVADTRNDTVRRFSPFGRAVGRLGLPPERAPGAARRDRVGVLDRPNAVAVREDIVYVACGERKLVRGVQRFHRDGRSILPLCAFGEADGRFGAPRGIHASDQGVFVADTLHGAIQHFRLDGPFVHQFPTGRRPDEASRPVAVLSLGDELLVVDRGDRPGLRRYSIGGEHRATRLDLRAGVRDPIDLARDTAGRIYVLDRDGERVLRLHPDLTFDEQIVDLREVF